MKMVVLVAHTPWRTRTKHCVPAAAAAAAQWHCQKCRLYGKILALACSRAARRCWLAE